MKRVICLLASAFLCSAAATQDRAQHEQTRPVVLMPGFGDLHHPVSAKNPEAQKFFDQGLRQIYAFNHDEAARSFQHAAEIEPGLAMAYWGVAEAVGPNYNDPADDVRFKQAHDAIQKAVTLSNTATPSERDYIAAMAKRFPAAGADLRKAAEDYRDAMREVMKKYPDDLDAATLFAESAMNIHRWGLWHPDGTPEAGTEEIIATLESVIKRDPNHLGAVHYYIHAVEASPNPQRALASAERLAALAPAAGHIVHMPAHIYIRTGDYAAAVATNEKAVAADEAYIKENATPGMYSMMYYSHNLHFIAISASMEGDYADAHKASKALYDHVAPFVKDVPPLEGFMTVPLAIEVRFRMWDQILAMPQPDASLKTVTAYWHFARGMALASKGKMTEAEAEHKFLAETEKSTPADTIFAMPINNKTKDILKIAENVLAAKIAIANGHPDAALAELRDAVALQDALKYDEPPDWFFPVRESLGAALLKGGDAAGAEKAFRDDLNRNPRNPRSLFGLEQALKAQGQDYDAQFVDVQFRASWKGDAEKLSVADLM